jgi:hypothetical protein
VQIELSAVCFGRCQAPRARGRRAHAPRAVAVRSSTRRSPRPAAVPLPTPAPAPAHPPRAADRNGVLLDAAHAERPAAFAGALRLLAGAAAAPQLRARGLDEALVMAPFDFAPQCEVGASGRRGAGAGGPAHPRVHAWPCQHALPCFPPSRQVMLLALSAPACPLRRSDLGCARQLRFRVTARDKRAAEEAPLVDADLAPLVRGAAERSGGPLSNGHQSMLVAAVYLVRRLLGLVRLAGSRRGVRP